jgi:hypothetical protein
MFGLSFLSPAFLLGALVAALPIALHLVGRRPEVRVLFPAVRLLKRAPAQETRRRRLRELLLLALRVASILLLALAFARPYIARAVPQPRASAVVVALDRSFSMSAPGQFALAVSLARDAIARVPPGAPVGLLVFDDDAEVLARPTLDRSAVLRLLEGLQPGYGGTSYGAALASAADTLGAAPGRVVLVTDLQRSGWDHRDIAIPDRVDVTVQEVGGPVGNLSVGGLRRSENGLAAVVRNHGSVRRTGRARLTIGGRLRGVMPFSIEPGASQEIVFAGPVPPTGDAVVEIDDAIGYQADNTAYALLDPPEPLALLAVTGDGDPSRGAFYLQRALEVDNRQIFRLDTDTAARFSAHASAAMLEKYSGAILLGTRGLRASAASALGEYVAAGGGLLVVLDDQVDWSSLTDVLGTPASVSFDGALPPGTLGLVASDLRHPILQPFEAGAFGDVRFERIARAEAMPGTVLARFTDGHPALVEQRRGAGRVLVFGSDLSNRWNDLPLQPAFLPLVHQIARYLAGSRLPARDLIVSFVPAGVPRQPGIANLRSGQAVGQMRRIAVNVDPRESEIGRMTVAEFEQVVARRRGVASGHAPVDPRQAEQQQGGWRFAIAVAIGLLLAEGLLGKPAGAAVERP